MKNFFKKNWLLLFFAVFSLVPVFWTSFDKIIAGGDDIIFFDPAAYFKFSVWDNSGYYSGFSNYLSRIFPFGFFWWFFQNLGFGNPLIEKIWLWSMWFVGCASVAYLSKIFFPKNYKTISAFAAVFYFLNSFTVFIPLTIAIIYAHTFLPLILAFFIRGIKSESRNQRFFYAIAFGLATLFASPVFASPPNALVVMLLPLFYFLFSVYGEGFKNFSGKISFSAMALMAFILFNLYHIWSTFFIYFFRPADNILASLGSNIFGTTALFEVFRTLGGWAFGGDPRKTYELIFYTNALVVFSSYFLVFIAFLSLFYIRKNKNILFLFLTSIIFIFLIKGTLAPLGGLFQHLFNTFGFFKGFREPWTKFSPPFILSLSILFGYSCYAVMDYLKRFKNKFLVPVFLAAVVLALCSIGYPSILGKNHWDLDYPGAKSTKVKVPAYWEELAGWFYKNNKDNPVLISPKDLLPRDYEWESGISSQAPLEVLLLKNPLRYPNYLIDFGIPDFDKFFVYFNSLHNLNTDNFYNFLSMLGIEYVIQENDVFWKLKDRGLYSPEIMKEVLSKKDFLEKVKTFGKIDVYRVKESFQNPIAYASRKIVKSDGPAYAFSSWNERETENFSLVENKDWNIKTGDFEMANQIFINNNPDAQAEMGEKNFNFKVEQEGNYAVVMKIADSGKINEFPLSYKIGNGAWQDKSVKIERNQVIKNNLDELGYVQVFSDIDLGSAILNEGQNSLKIKSDTFKNKDFGGIIYIALNKHFSGNGKEKDIPEIKVEKSSDTRYTLDVKNGDRSPYMLNFALNFDRDWQIYLLEDKKNILDVPHLKVSGGAGNGWYIDPADTNGKEEYKLSIEYRPQRYFVWFLWVSILSIAAGIFLALRLAKNRNE